MLRQSSIKVAGSPGFGALFSALLCLVALGGCEPTPDYKIFVHDVPQNAAMLLVAVQTDSNTVSKTSLAVPVSQLSADERKLFTIGASLQNFSGQSGVISLGVIDANGCLVTVVSATQREAPSSNGTVTDVDLELASAANTAPFSISSAAFLDPATCSKVPGLSNPLPTVPVGLTTPFMVINVARELHGTLANPVAVFHLYGWGFEQGQVTTQFEPINGQLPGCVTSLMTLFGANNIAPSFSYGMPGFTVLSPAELDLSFANLQSLFGSNPNLEYQVFSCYAIVPFIFQVKSQAAPGRQVTFTEPT